MSRVPTQVKTAFPSVARSTSDGELKQVNADNNASAGWNYLPQLCNVTAQLHAAGDGLWVDAFKRQPLI
jgi:hypothetical protein